MRVLSGVATDVGRVREGNEDAFLVDPPLYAVADGLGGARAGEVASQLALHTFDERYRAGDGSLADHVRAANRVVFDRAAEDARYEGMGTTLTAALIATGSAHLVHVGDSRAYLYRAEDLRQLTEDHTLVNRMVRAGEITRAEAEMHPHRNVVLRALGTEPTVEVDEQDVGLLEGDRLLLCSDGLTTMVTEDQIAAILAATPGTPQDAADRLVRAANRAGGIDNITVVVLDLLPGDAEEGAPAAPAAPTPKPKGSRRWLRWVVVAVAAAALLVMGIAALRSYTDSRWYVGETNGHVAIFQGIPAAPLGFELSHVDVETNLDANAVEELGTLSGSLSEGINADSRGEALAIVEQMRRDLDEAAQGGKGNEAA
jgi:protein phosphatase